MRKLKSEKKCGFLNSLEREFRAKAMRWIYVNTIVSNRNKSLVFHSKSRSFVTYSRVSNKRASWNKRASVPNSLIKKFQFSTDFEVSPHFGFRKSTIERRFLISDHVYFLIFGNIRHWSFEASTPNFFEFHKISMVSNWKTLFNLWSEDSKMVRNF